MRYNQHRRRCNGARRAVYCALGLPRGLPSTEKLVQTCARRLVADLSVDELASLDEGRMPVKWAPAHVRQVWDSLSVCQEPAGGISRNRPARAVAFELWLPANTKRVLQSLELECGSKFIDHSEFGFKVIAHSPDCKQYCRIQFFKRVKKMFCQPWNSNVDLNL